MDHCEVLALLGVPNRQAETRAFVGTTMTWYFQRVRTIGRKEIRESIVQFRAGPDGHPRVSAVAW